MDMSGLPFGGALEGSGHVHILIALLRYPSGVVALTGDGVC